MPCIAKLAHEAFPPCELIAPFCVDELSEAEFEHLVAVDDGQFLGFATVRRWQNLVYLAFLAVNLNIRNSGVGAQILNALTNKFADAIVVAEIENPYENCCDSGLCDGIFYRRKIRNGKTFGGFSYDSETENQKIPRAYHF